MAIFGLPVEIFFMSIVQCNLGFLGDYFSRFCLHKMRLLKRHFNVKQLKTASDVPTKIRLATSYGF